MRRSMALCLLYVGFSGAAFAQEVVIDPAPSGTSTQETYTDGNSSVSMPGADGTVGQTTDGNTTTLDFDPSGSEVTGSDSPDTTVIYDNN